MNSELRGIQPPTAPVPRISRFTLGPFETNCYVVSPNSPDRGGECWIVDASFDPEPIIEHVHERGLKPTALVLTHCHVDHIAGVDQVVQAFPGLPVWVHEAEQAWLSDPMLNLSAMMGTPVVTVGPHRVLHGGEELSMGPLGWRVLHTPGHSPGGITLYHALSGTALVGDTLFAGSIGRSDFPSSDESVLHASIRDQLYRLPDQTSVHPGHGPATTIGREKRTNPFVRA